MAGAASAARSGERPTYRVGHAGEVQPNLLGCVTVIVVSELKCPDWSGATASSGRVTAHRGFLLGMLAAVAVGIILVGLESSASATSARDHRYSGVCQITGTAAGYDPPLSFHPAARTFHFLGKGKCTGSIDSHKAAQTIQVLTSIHGKTTVDSCNGFGITENATGMLEGIGSPQARTLRVPFRTDVFIDGLTVTTATIGDHGGAALGTGKILPDQATVNGCIRGTLEKLRFTITMHTVTPFVIEAAGSPSTRRPSRMS